MRGDVGKARQKKKNVLTRDSLFSFNVFRVASFEIHTIDNISVSRWPSRLCSPNARRRGDGGTEAINNFLARHWFPPSLFPFLVPSLSSRQKDQRVCNGRFCTRSQQQSHHGGRRTSHRSEKQKARGDLSVPSCIPLPSLCSTADLCSGGMASSFLYPPPCPLFMRMRRRGLKEERVTFASLLLHF